MENLEETVSKRFAGAVEQLRKAGARLSEEKFALLADMVDVNSKGGVAPVEAFSIHRELMSRTVERSDNAAAHPLVKAYTRERLRQMFAAFTDISMVQRQLQQKAAPKGRRFVPRQRLGRIMGWNLVIKARKPKR